MKFKPSNLAGAGIEYLHFGGYVDPCGDVFREKDVLEDDFSQPYLLYDEEYDVLSVKDALSSLDCCVLRLQDRFGVISSLLLSKDEVSSLDNQGICLL